MSVTRAPMRPTSWSVERSKASQTPRSWTSQWAMSLRSQVSDCSRVRERLVGGRDLRAELGGAGALTALVGDEAAGEQQHEQRRDDDEDDREDGHAADYSSTLRAARCVPTLRFTRCSALSTVLV